MKKKAQIKLFESIAVLLIFAFLVAIGTKFYTNVQLQTLKDAERNFARLDSVKTSIELTNLPELMCSQEGVFDSTCTDYYKLVAWFTILQNNTQFQDYYYSSLGKSKIILERHYPIGTSNRFLLYDYNATEKNSVPLIVPTNLYDPISGRNQLAIITIISYYD